MEKQPDKESALLGHPVIPIDDFRKKLKAIMSVPKAELDESLERERKANEGNRGAGRNRGRTPKMDKNESTEPGNVFDRVLRITKSPGELAPIPVDFGNVRSSVRTKGNKTEIRFDLFHLDFDLLPSVRESLTSEYDAYCSANFKNSDYNGGVGLHFGETSIQFSVFEVDAREWFVKVYSLINTQTNFMPVTI